MASSRQVDALERLGFQFQAFDSRDLDLTDDTAVLDWSVGDYLLGSIHVSGTNAVAVLEAQRSFDGGQNFEPFSPPLKRLGSGRIRQIPLHQVDRLRLLVETDDPAGTEETVRLYADQAREPFQHREVLAQGNYTPAAAASIYAPSGYSEITGVVLCANTADAEVSLWLDADGTTYDDTTVLVKDWTIRADERSVIWDGLRWPIAYPGNLAISAATSNITITVFGWES